MDIFSIFFSMKVYCVFSLESPQRGDSNEYIHVQYTISQYKKEIHPKLSQICNYGICSKGLKKEFETAVVNEPSVFEPLKFYCISEYIRHYPSAHCTVYFLINKSISYTVWCGVVNHTMHGHIIRPVLSSSSFF